MGNLILQNTALQTAFMFNKLFGNLLYYLQCIMCMTVMQYIFFENHYSYIHINQSIVLEMSGIETLHGN